MRVRTLEDLRKIAPPDKQRLSDEELVIDFANVTGNNPQEVAEYMGLSTGRRSSSFGAGVGMGVDQVQSMLAGTGAAVAESLGAKQTRDALEDEVRAQQAQAYLARNPNTPQRIEDVGSLSEFGSYVAGQVGQQVPIMGGILAAGAATGGLGLGASTGALGAGYTYGVGSLYNESVEGGQRDAAGALMGGVPYAAAEALVPLGLGRLARGAVGSNLLTATTRKGAIGQATAGGAIAEGATEAFQTELEMNMRDDLTPEEKASRRLNAVVAGGLIGGGFSGVGGAFAKLPDPNADPEGNDLTSGGDTGVGNELDPETYAEEVAARRRQRQEAARRKIEGGLERDPFEPIPADASPVERQRILEARIEARERSISQAAAQAAADAQQAETLNNQLKELEQLGASRLPESEVESIKAEMKLAQEQLEATRQGFSSAQELSEAEARLNELEAEITAPAPKGKSARKFKEQQRARAAETLEERTGLEATIDTLKQQQFAENQGNAEQALLYELHLEKLQEQLDAHAEARFARRAMRRIRGRGIKLSEITAKQVSEAQADIESRMADREASLSGEPAGRTDVSTEPAPVETTSPIVETVTEPEPTTEPTYEPAPDELFTVARDVGGANLVEDVAYSDLTAEEKASRQVQDQIKRKAQAAPRGEVVQTAPEEELVTEADVIASEKAAENAVNKLNADIKSDKTKVAGKITRPQNFIAAAARHLRAATPNGANTIYEPGTANPTQQTEKDTNDLNRIREAAFAVVAAAMKYNNAASNVVKMPDELIAEDYDKAEAAAFSSLSNRVDLQQDLESAVQEFIDASGGAPNANAIIAAFKTIREKKGKSRNLTDNESAFVNSLLPATAGYKFNKLSGFNEAFDIQLSNAVRRYIDGDLSTTADFAPKSLDVQANKKEQRAESRAGIRLFEEDLQAAFDRGQLGNSARQTVDPRTKANLEAALNAKLEPILNELRKRRDGVDGRKKISSKEYVRRRKALKARAEKELDRAVNQLQATIDERRATTQGLEAVVNRALDSGTANVTERMFAKLIRKVIAAQKKAGIPPVAVEFSDKESSFDPKKGDGGTITIQRETSPEVVLHEVLHALLQGFVYRNRSSRVKGSDPATVQTIDVLKDYVKTLVALDVDTIEGLTTSQKQKAVEVIGKLRDIVNKGGANAEVDAVLELVSYGNTLKDFKLLLANMEQTRSEANSQWKALLDGVWKLINEVLNYLIGRPKNSSAANDVLTATVELLQDAAANPQQTRPETRGASKLFSGVQTTATSPEIDLQAYGKQGTYGFTKPIFDLMGKALPDDMPSRLKTMAGEVREAVIKAFPGSEKVLRGFNPLLAFGEQLQKVFQTFKNEKHTGVQLAELVSQHIRDMIEADIRAGKNYKDGDTKKLIDYLDGNKAALDGVPSARLIRKRADNLLEAFATFKTALPESYRQFFDGRKFSESLIFVEKETDIGSGSVGQRKLNEIFGGRKQELEKSDNPEWLGLEKDGDVFDSNAIYYRVVDNTAGRADHGRTIGFVREDKAEDAGGVAIENQAGESFAIDMDTKWSGKDAAGGKFSFTSNKTIGEALKDGNSKEAADQIGKAILNTANTLGTYYSSKRFLSGLAGLGRDANGELDEKAFERGEVPVVFDSVDQYNEYLAMTAAEGETVRPINDKQVPKASASELKSGLVAGELRRSGTLVRIPDTSALKEEGLPVKVWGDLAGKVVSGPVYAAIVDMSSKHNLFDKAVLRSYNEALRQFKLSKTTRNPGTHITNVASNVVIMMMHGITFKTAKRAAGILYKASRNPDALSDQDLLILQQFEKSGALLGNFSASEIKRERYLAMRDQIRPDMDNKGVPGRVAELLRLESDNAKAVGNWIAKKDQQLLELYAAEDNVFRLAAFMNRAGELQAQQDGAALTDAQWKQAGDFGRDAFLNYDIDSKYLQYARQTVMPFASWTYAAIPMLGKIALTRPWMIANVLTSYALLDAAMAALAGEDEEDRNKLGKMYNEKLFFNMGPNAMVRIPFLGDDQNPVYFRLGDYIPLSSTMRGTPAGFMGFENWPGGFTPNGPLVTIAGAMLNTNTYTGKKLNDPTDSAADVTLTNIGLMVDMFLPPMASTRNVEKLGEYLAGDQTISGRDMTATFAARAFGLKFYDPNVAEEFMYKRIEEKQIKRDYGIAISRAKREELRSGAPDFDRLYNEIDNLNQDMREEIDKLYNRD